MLAVATDIESATLGPTVEAFEVYGFAAPGDDGGGVYRRVGSPPSHAGWRTSADGAICELVTRIARPSQFGVPAGGDHTALIQAALDYPAGEVELPDIGIPWAAAGLVLDGKRLTGGRGARLKLAPGAGTFLLKMKGEEPAIEALEIDGNGSAQSSNIELIATEFANRPRLRRVRVANVFYKFLLTDQDSPGGRVLESGFADCSQANSGDVFAVRSGGWAFFDDEFEQIGNGHCIRFGLFRQLGPNGEVIYTDDLDRPVVGGEVDFCRFRDTQHVGVTCEIYSRRIGVRRSDFANMPTVLKCEGGEVFPGQGSTVWDVTFERCSASNINSAVPFNFGGIPGVRFDFNHLRGLAGKVSVGSGGSTRGNVMDGCGAVDGPALALSTGAVATENDILSPVAYGVELKDGGAFKGGRIQGCVEAAVRMEGAGNLLHDSDVDGAPSMVELISTAAAGNEISGNRPKNISGPSVIGAGVSGIWSGAVIYRDNGGAAVRAVVIDDGQISVEPDDRLLIVDTEAGAALDDLVTLNGGYPGQEIFLRSVTQQRKPTIKKSAGGVGNIDCGADFQLAGAASLAALVKRTSGAWSAQSTRAN